MDFRQRSRARPRRLLLPTAAALLYGIKPVIIAVILQAIYNLGGKAAKRRSGGSGRPASRP